MLWPELSKTLLMILQVVDFPLVPVTIIDLKNFFVKKNKSISVITLFWFLRRVFLYLDFLKLIPGLSMIKSASLIFFFLIFWSFPLF